jgi:hypothetical protein
VPEKPKVISLKVEDFLDTACHGCCTARNGGTAIVNPKMCCTLRRNGEYCKPVIEIGMLVCKRTSLENRTTFEEF